MHGRHLTVGGCSFERVTERASGVSVYKGDGCYLRIGAGVGEELAVHRWMSEQGFPVADILRTGNLNGVPYSVEESLGDSTLGNSTLGNSILGNSTLGDLFADELAIDGRVSPAAFAAFEKVIERHARAQANVAGRTWSSADFAQLVGLTGAVALVPDLRADIEAAFVLATHRLGESPGTLLHGDLHPYNVCPGGVIDLEETGWGPVGYDTVTAVFVATLCDPAWAHGSVTRTWFSPAQFDSHLAIVDDVFASAGLGRPSTRLDELVVCRAVSLCSRRHPDEEVWNARRSMLRQVVRNFLADRPALPA